MFQVINGAERADRSALFQQLYKKRREVFVDGRGWALPLKAGVDIDPYDRDDAFYVVITNDDDDVIGGLRVNRSDRGCLSADLFPHLYAGGSPITDERIYEGTRYFVSPTEKDSALVRRLRCELVATAFERVMELGGTHFQTVVDTPMLGAFMEMSPRVIVLGNSHPYGGGRRTPGGGECVLMQVPVDELTISQVRAAADPGQRSQSFDTTH
ncbi:MAG: GNAT family N-acetyltransferase [Devosiaceae bacterium]|nr:GNAT family N-acetyltransferase [Devosiaceae bacterium MH13]